MSQKSFHYRVIDRKGRWLAISLLFRKEADRKRDKIWTQRDELAAEYSAAEANKKRRLFDAEGAFQIQRVEKPTREEIRRRKIVELAREEISGDGTVDDDAAVHEGSENGCYVTVKVWLSFEDTPLDKNK